MSRSKIATIAVLTAAALAPVALAGPPKPEDPAIEPGVSIGGVSVGQPVDEAEAAWGDDGACDPNGRLRICEYGSSRRGLASFGSIDGVVKFVSINAPLTASGNYHFDGPLMEFGTLKGDLGLGDRVKRIAKRYPDGKLKKGRLTFAGDGSRMTFTGKRVVQIALTESSP